MSALPALRKLLKRLVRTSAELEAFILDYFKEEVFDHCNVGHVDRTAVENFLLQRVLPAQLIEALFDWADRNELPFSLSEDLDDSLLLDPRLDRLIHQSATQDDGLLSRARHACALRERKYRDKGLSISRITPYGELSVFHVSYREDGFPTSYALGVSQKTPQLETLEKLCAVLKERQLPSGYALPSVLVYAGAKPAESLFAQARTRNIKLRSIDEYELLLDNLPQAVAAQHARLQQYENYRPELYVPQRGEIAAGSSFRFGVPTCSMREQLLSMLHSDEAQFILILGEFGLGKTFLMYELLRALSKSGEAPWPVLCELRNIEKKQSLDALLAWQLQDSGIAPIDPEAFRHLVRLGKIILFFDGFDELALRTTYDRAAEHLETLLGAVEGRAKVVLSSRTQHFHTDRQIKTALAERLERVPSRIVRLLKFQPTQIQQYLEKRLSTKAAARRYKLLRDVHNLLGLSENPRMLSFIAELDESRLLAVKKQQGRISAAELYRLIINEWLKFEVARVRQAGSSLTEDQLLIAMLELARLLWRKSERSATLDELEVGAQAALLLVGKARVKGGTAISAAEALHQVGAASLLLRDGEGRFSFLHQSVLEWLLANDAATQLRRNVDDGLLDQGEMSPLMAEFFIDLCGNEESSGEARAISWLTTRLSAEADIADAAWSKRNALRVAERLKTAIPVLCGRTLSQQDLRKEDFTGHNLSFSNLSRSLLQGVSLARAQLQHANLRGAQLADADLRGADLRQADLRDADLSRARLMHADLRGAQLEGAKLRRVKLAGCRMDDAALALLSTPGASGSASPTDRDYQRVTSRGLSSWKASIAVSWDAELFVSAMGKEIGVWDLSSGQLLRVLCGHEITISSVALSADGKTLASSSVDGCVRLSDAVSGATLHIISEHRSAVHGLSLSADGKLLTSADGEGAVRLWDTASGKILHQLEGHKGVWSVALSADGKTLAAGTADGTVWLWHTDTAVVSHVLSGHRGFVWSVALSADGKTLASGDEGGTVRIWDAATGNLQHVLPGHKSVWRVALSTDGKVIASGDGEGTVRLWNATTGAALFALSGHRGSVYGLALSPDGKTLASAAEDRAVRLWDTTTGAALQVLFGHKGGVNSVAISADGAALASADSHGSVCLWNAELGIARHLVGESEVGVWSVAISADGKMLAAADSGGSVRVWHASGNEPPRIYAEHRGSVWSVALSADGNTLASADSGGTVRLWNLRANAAPRILSGHKGIINKVVLSADGKYVASGGADDRTVRLWDAQTAAALHVLSGHKSDVWSVALSSDGKTLASASEDGTVRIWDTQSGALLFELSAHARGVLSVALSADGATLASGGRDGQVRLWDASSGAARKTLSVHTAEVWSVALSADGKLLASGTDDGTARLWDVASGCCVAALVPGQSGWAAFSKDGRYKCGGNPRDVAWLTIGLCRYELAIMNADGTLHEPGDLDEVIPGLRLENTQPLFSSS